MQAVFDTDARAIASKLAADHGAPKTRDEGLRAIHAVLQRGHFASDQAAWEAYSGTATSSRRRYYEWKKKLIVLPSTQRPSVPQLPLPEEMGREVGSRQDTRPGAEVDDVLALMVNLEPMLAESTAAHLSPQRTVASSRALAADLLHWENNLSLQTPGGTHHTVQYLTKRTPEGELLSSTVRAARKTSDRKLKFNAKQELRVNVAAHSRDWSELSEEERHAAHMFGFEDGTIWAKRQGTSFVPFHSPLPAWELPWNALSVEHLHGAATLGYNRSSWNNELLQGINQTPRHSLHAAGQDESGCWRRCKSLECERLKARIAAIEASMIAEAVEANLSRLLRSANDNWHTPSPGCEPCGYSRRCFRLSNRRHWEERDHPADHKMVISRKHDQTEAEIFLAQPSEMQVAGLKEKWAQWVSQHAPPHECWECERDSKAVNWSLFCERKDAAHALETLTDACDDHDSLMLEGELPHSGSESNAESSASESDAESSGSESDEENEAFLV